MHQKCNDSVNNLEMRKEDTQIRFESSFCPMIKDVLENRETRIQTIHYFALKIMTLGYKNLHDEHATLYQWK